MKSINLPSKGVLLSCVMVFGITLGLTIPAIDARAKSGDSGPARVTERGSNYRIWERTVAHKGQNGTVKENTSTYTELGTGLCYQDKNGRWIDSDPQIVGQLDGTGQGENAGHSVRFLPDINSDGSIVSTAGGKTLRSHVLGICYYDWKNQREVQVGSIQSSVGKIVGKNKVIYTDAFSGLKADVQYEFKMAGIGQDILFREQLPSPADFQMDPATTRVEVWTEFLQPPASKLRHIVKGRNGQEDHQVIDFDGVRIGRGAAFATPTAKTKIPVQKQWQTIDGRTFLIESLNYQTILPELAKLPQHAQAAFQKRGGAVAKGAKDRHVPARIASVPNSNLKLQIASAVPDEKGFLLDYETITSFDDKFFFTLEAGKTYYINGSLMVEFSLTIEGGTVVKFGPDGSIFGGTGGEGDDPGSFYYGPGFGCNTGPYRPAVFTSKDDDSVGETISGSSGSPTTLTNCWGYNGGDLHDVRFSYIGHPFNSWDATLENVQFLHCTTPLSMGGTATAKNCLFYDFDTLVTSSEYGSGSVQLYNSTVASGNSAGGYAVNCIFSDIGDTSGMDGTYNGFYNTTAFGDPQIACTNFPFQTVGGGRYYLAASEFSAVGTTDSLPDGLLPTLAGKTTQPPILLTNDVTNVTVLSPIVSRDTNASPDLGYHYAPIDYLIGGLAFATNVTLTNGVTLAFHPAATGSDYDGFPALVVQYGTTISSQGSPTNPNHIVWYDTVQESTNSDWSSNTDMLSTAYNTALNCRFTHFSRLAGPAVYWNEYNYLTFVKLRDCEFYNGFVYLGAPASTIGITNCLFDYCNVDMWLNSFETSPVYFLNCLFRQNTMHLDGNSSQGELPLTFTNCFFETTNISYYYYPAIIRAGYNAFFMSDPGSYIPTNSNDIVIAALAANWWHDGPFFTYTNGPLGNFYQLTNSALLNQGSQLATALTLSHYTVLSDQTPEGTNRVSIGYHYAALDGSNNPVDSDTDSVPDYIEDPYGNMFGSPPIVMTQPASTTATTNSTATFTVTSIGTTPLSYQWQFDGTNITDATASSLALTNPQPTDAGSYSVIVTNAYGSATSDNAILTIAGTPQITSDPASLTKNSGQTATFTVSSTGTAPLSYQWKLNGNNISGATLSSVSRSAGSSTVGSYTVVITNIAGSTTSATATLTLSVAPAITTQPASLTVNPGSTVSFAVTATGTPAPYYQWRFNGSDIVGATASAYSRVNVQNSDAGSYTVIVSNMAGSVTSSAATLTLNVPASITTQPASVTQNPATTATFSVAAAGTTPFSYQWRKNGNAISGATLGSYSIVNIQTSDSASYTVVITNVVNAVTSSVATLTLNTPPSISTQPVSQTLDQADSTNFTVVASGTAPLSYQWQKNGVNIAGATTTILNKTNVQDSDEGSYTVIVTNIAGVVTSDIATLTVDTPPSIISQPISLTVAVGDTATFTVVAAGDPTIQYQWEWQAQGATVATNIDDATNSTLTITNVQCTDAGTYAVLIANGFGQLESLDVTLAVKPFITSQPVSETLNKGQTATFSVSACGSSPLSYRWYLNGTFISGATTSSYTRVNVGNAGIGSYTVVITNAAGTKTSDPATLTVNTIAVTPMSQIVNEGDPTSICAEDLTGIAPFAFQWRHNGTNLPSATSSCYSIAAAGATYAGTYSVIATFNTSLGTASLTSSNATVAVVIKPHIPIPPAADLTVFQGHSATYSMAASGTEPLTYSWQSNTVELADTPGKIAGTSTIRLTILNVQTTDAASYTVSVANTAGSATSDPSTLTVLTVTPLSQTNNPGQTATFTLNSTGALPSSYQWRHNGTDIPGATTNPLVITNVQPPDAGSYTVVVGTDSGTLTSDPVTLVLNSVTISPTNRTVVLGASATFQALTNGSSASAFQWQFAGADLANGGNFAGVTTSSLTILSSQSTNVGSYTVVATFPAGQLASAAATLTVNIPPSISGQPQSLTKNRGDTATFCVTAAGTAPLSYQWRKNGGNITGATASCYSISNVQSSDAATYSVVVTNVAGSVTSSNATLTVNTITVSPLSKTVPLGTNVIFTANHTGTTPSAYQWQFNGTDLVDGGNFVGVTTSSLTILSAQSTNTGSYDAVATFAAGPLTSSSATLVVEVPPSITCQPISQTAIQGTNVTFTVCAAGDAPLHYQWKHGNADLGNGSHIAGATTSCLTILNVTQSGDSGTYSVVITNAVGSATSSNATLTIIIPPTIVTPPANQLAVLGMPATFSVEVDPAATALVSYQWKTNGTDIPNATSRIYTIPAAQASDATTYTVMVSNVAGTNSPSATLTVITNEPDCGSGAPTQLAYWSFDAGDNQLAGDRGQLPVVSDGVQQVSGYSDAAIAFTGFWPSLTYRYVDTDGQPNINCTKGAIAFWFNPNTSDIYSHQSESLVQVGHKYDCTGGWWSFGFDDSGTSLTFQTMSNGVQTTFLTTTMTNWDQSQWYHLILSYSPTNTALYTNGVQAATGGGVTNYPSLAIRQRYGLTIGPSDVHDCCQAPGAIDEFKTFNCPLTTNDISNIYPGP